ncbi:MAG: asparagine synthase C-terminal domain-containing protein, partial [Planctomycetota bacterium]
PTAAAISLYFISKKLRESVTVALSGEGADELFGGYSIYRLTKSVESFRRLPRSLRRLVAEPILGSLGAKARKHLRLARLPIEERYAGVHVIDPAYREALYTDDYRAFLSREHRPDYRDQLYQFTAGMDTLTRMLHVDLKTWLVDDLLIKADKMTMANSVELRVPFLDHKVVEFAATVPSRMKVRGREGKWILKQAMSGHLPQEIISRSKLGFPTPLARMFQSSMGDYLFDVLLSPSAAIGSYFKRSVVEGLLREHVSRRRDHHAVLWQLLVLEEWHRAFVGQESITTP